MENKTIEQKVAAMDSFLQVIVDQDFKFPAIPERLKEKFPDDMKEVIISFPFIFNLAPGGAQSAVGRAA